jgi:light-regulated signal transduction histidine kinase (bacteriophytochrome)
VSGSPIEHGEQTLLRNLHEQVRALEDSRRAIVNIVEDLTTDKRFLEETQAAFMNILEDLKEEIAGHKIARERIEHLNLELETRMAQLNDANKELDAFAYSVSHDLRAPLRHVDGFIQLLSKHLGQDADERTLEYLSIIADSATKMGKLIGDLLSFSRMGRADIAKTSLNLNALIEEILKGSESDTKGRTITWNIARLPAVEGDQTLLRLVLQNLISNAIKFTRPREVARIEIGCNDRPSGEIVFFIRDNGVGFDTEYAGKLFGMFQRLHKAEEFEGTGIGLANVRRIINRHGGRTWAEGKTDEGAVFYWSLPKPREPARERKSLL